VANRFLPTEDKYTYWTFVTENEAFYMSDKTEASHISAVRTPTGKFRGTLSPVSH